MSDLIPLDPSSSKYILRKHAREYLHQRASWVKVEVGVTYFYNDFYDCFITLSFRQKIEHGITCHALLNKLPWSRHLNFGRTETYQSHPKTTIPAHEKARHCFRESEWNVACSAPIIFRKTIVTDPWRQCGALKAHVISSLTGPGMRPQEQNIHPTIELFTHLKIFFSVIIPKHVSLYNVDPLKPHAYIVKLEFTGVCIIFLILLKT